MAKSSIATRRASVETRVLEEGYTMALYVCVVLLAALEAMHDTNKTFEVIELIWGTTIGLALAHWFAFAWAGRLVQPDGSASERRRAVGAQLVGALGIALPMSLVVLLSPPRNEREAAQTAAAILIGGLVYAEKRLSGSPRAQAVLLSAVALVLALLTALVKNAVMGH